MEKDISSITILNVIGKFVKELKMEGYVDEQTKQQRRTINSRYYGSNDRRSVYRTWLENRGYERQSRPELSNLLSQAKERAIIKILENKKGDYI